MKALIQLVDDQGQVVLSAFCDNVTKQFIWVHDPRNMDPSDSEAWKQFVPDPDAERSIEIFGTGWTLS